MTLVERQNHIKQMWVVFNDAEPFVIEIRAIWPKGIGTEKSPCSICFHSVRHSSNADFRDAVEQQVIKFNQQGYNVYATLNPIKLAFNSRTASDDDIACRRRLLIDIDRDQGKEHPASDSEIQDAKNLGNHIERYLKSLGWPVPVQMMSGNGHHLIYSLNDFPNTKETTREIRGFLLNLKLRFSSNGLNVDTTVSNASRITKIPGTLARRGIEAENRPYRLARIYE